MVYALDEVNAQRTPAVLRRRGGLRQIPTPHEPVTQNFGAERVVPDIAQTHVEPQTAAHVAAPMAATRLEVARRMSGHVVDPTAQPTHELEKEGLFASEADTALFEKANQPTEEDPLALHSSPFTFPPEAHQADVTLAPPPEPTPSEVDRIVAAFEESLRSHEAAEDVEKQEALDEAVQVGLALEYGEAALQSRGNKHPQRRVAKSLPDAIIEARAAKKANKIRPAATHYDPREAFTVWPEQ